MHAGPQRSRQPLLFTYTSHSNRRAAKCRSAGEIFSAESIHPLSAWVQDSPFLTMSASFIRRCARKDLKYRRSLKETGFCRQTSQHLPGVT